MATRRPTISDVARSAGVSKGAVSFALNDRPGVAPETRDRILGRPPSSAGRPAAGPGPVGSRALAVGLVIARPPETLGADPFFPRFIAGIETALSPRGQCAGAPGGARPRRELDGYRRLAADGRVDGVFLTDLRVDDPRPALLAELGLPAVLDRPDCTDDEPSRRRVDDRPGIAAAVRHLVELGHRRIAHVAGPADFVHGVSRRAGLGRRPARGRAARGTVRRRRLHGAGRRRRHHAHCSTCADAADRDRLRQRPDGHRRPGRRGEPRPAVPDDLSVTGFDDTELAAHLQPALTTVRTDAYALGQGAAARACWPAVDGGQSPTSLLRAAARSSSGPPPRHLRDTARPHVRHETEQR